MHLKVEKKRPSFYLLEKHLIGSNPHWFYLYDLRYNAIENTLTIDIGPNNNKADKKRWLFRSVHNFQEGIDGEDEGCVNFPQMILGIDSYRDATAVIACSDVEYSFKSPDLPAILSL